MYHHQTESECSIEIKGSGGARKSKLCLSSDIISFPSEAYDNVETAWEVLERACRLYGNNRAFGRRNSQTDYTWINYNEFKERARNFGSGLVNIGVTPGQDTFIGIYGHNSLEWLVAQYGIFSQSAAVTAVYDGYGMEFMIKTINRSELELIICGDSSKAENILHKSTEIPSVKHVIVMGDVTEELKQLAIAKDVRMYSFRDVEELGKEKSVPLLLPVASDVYMICFTSGTTGDPKGALLTHKYFVCSGYSCLMMFESGGVSFSETDVMISHVTLNHILEQIMKMVIILVGGGIGFFGGDHDKLEEDIEVLRPTFFPALPLLLNKIYDKAQRLLLKSKSSIETLQIENMDGSRSIAKGELDTELCKQLQNMLGGKMRVILSTASAISDKVLHFYRFGLGYQVIDIYGQTETAGVSVKVVEKRTIGSGGRLYPSLITKLVDVPDLGYFSRNKEGEICVKGHTGFKCYLKNPSETAEKVDSEGWIHTGDVGKFLPDGSLIIVDRLTNIFKTTYGLFITPEKIENIYSRSTYVAQVFIYGDSMKDYLVSVVVPEKSVLLPYMKEILKCETTWSEACKSPIIKKLILSDMHRLGKEAGLLHFEQARAVYLHPDPLTHQGGQLTATLKIRRTICRDIFKSEIEALYEETDAMEQQGVHQNGY